VIGAANGKFLGVIAAAGLVAALCSAGCAVEAEYPVAGYGDYPSDAYIATTEPVYFEGRPAYWYGGHWYYRDGGRWRYYAREPHGLYERRARGPVVVRHTYEAPRVRQAGHPVGHTVVRPSHPPERR
jgi:hypothetical protein